MVELVFEVVPAVLGVFFILIHARLHFFVARFEVRHSFLVFCFCFGFLRFHVGLHALDLGFVVLVAAVGIGTPLFALCSPVGCCVVGSGCCCVRFRSRRIEVAG